MLILNAQILESQGIPYRAASKILFQERLFVKRQTFSQRVKQVAINLYEEYVNLGIPCLLIESTEQITFWRELQSESMYPAAAAKSRSAQSLIQSNSQAAKRLKHQSPQKQPKEQPKDAVRIEMSYRASIWSAQKFAAQKPTAQQPAPQKSTHKPAPQKPIFQKPAPQKSMTAVRQIQSSSTAVNLTQMAIAPAFIPPAPIPPAPIPPSAISPAPIPPAPIPPAPVTQISTLPAHLRRLTFR